METKSIIFIEVIEQMLSGCEEMKTILDELDKKIIHYVCSGVHSLNELGKLCNCGRSTVYRRMEKLEKMGFIKKKIMGVPDWSKLDLSAIILGIDISPEDIEKTVAFFLKNPKVKFVWRTYGSHNLVVAVASEKDKVGEEIYNLRLSLEKLGVKVLSYDISISITWDKLDMSPY